MALLEMSCNGTLRVNFPGMGELELPLGTSEGPILYVSMHRAVDCFEVVSENDAVCHWFSEALGSDATGPLRLVRLAEGFERRIPDLPGQLEQAVQLADGYPYLVASESSLSLLNEKLSRELEMTRFRPNIVLDIPEPWIEMRPGSISRDPESNVVLSLVKPCQRCGIPQINPATGRRDLGNELHETLTGLFTDATGPGNCFGQNATVASGIGASLRVGQTLVLETP